MEKARFLLLVVAVALMLFATLAKAVTPPSPVRNQKTRLPARVARVAFMLFFAALMLDLVSNLRR